MVAQPEAQVVEGTLGIDMSGDPRDLEESGDFRCKGESAFLLGKEKGFDAEEVASEYELSFREIDPGESEHPDGPTQEIDPLAAQSE